MGQSWTPALGYNQKPIHKGVATMAEFIYKSTIYGPQIFTVPDDGGIVELKGRKLTTFGGYLDLKTPRSSLRADAGSLEEMARMWWKKRAAHLSVLGHKANGVEP